MGCMGGEEREYQENSECQKILCPNPPNCQSVDIFGMSVGGRHKALPSGDATMNRAGRVSSLIWASVPDTKLGG